MATYATGTQAATISTKHTLSTAAGMGVYTLLVDASNMQAGDTLEIILGLKVTSVGTVRDVFVASFSDAQTTEPHKISIPINAPYGCTAYLRQTAGTGRSFDWTLLIN